MWLSYAGFKKHNTILKHNTFPCSKHAWYGGRFPQLHRKTERRGGGRERGGGNSKRNRQYVRKNERTEGREIEKWEEKENKEKKKERAVEKKRRNNRRKRWKGRQGEEKERQEKRNKEREKEEKRSWIKSHRTMTVFFVLSNSTWRRPDTPLQWVGDMINNCSDRSNLFPTYANAKRRDKLLNKVQCVWGDGGLAHCPSVFKSDSKTLCKPLPQLARHFLIPVLSEPHHLTYNIYG